MNDLLNAIGKLIALLIALNALLSLARCTAELLTV